MGRRLGWALAAAGSRGQPAGAPKPLQPGRKPSSRLAQRTARPNPQTENNQLASPARTRNTRRPSIRACRVRPKTAMLSS